MLLGFAGSVFAAPLDLEISHRDTTDTTDIAQNVTPFSYNGNSLMYFQGTGTGDGSVTTGNYAMLNVGSGIAIAGGNISVTPFSIETTDGHLSDTLGIINSSISSLLSLSSTVSSLSSTVSGLGAPLNIAAFMGSNASTSPFIASSTQNGFMSAGMAVKVASITTRSMATTTRSIVTGTGATGFQVSATRDAEVRYSTTIVTTSSILGSQVGTDVLEIGPTNSATSTDWSEIGRCTNGTAYTLAVAIQGVSTQACQITGYVPASYYVKIRSINVSGTPTFTYNSGQEVLQ